jgi:hypothetical protein
VLSTGTIVGPALTGLVLTTSTTTALLAVLVGGCLVAIGVRRPRLPGSRRPAQTAQALLAITAFNDLWDVALGLFGIHLLLEGFLVYRSG